MAGGEMHFKATLDDKDYNKKIDDMKKGVNGLNFDKPTESIVRLRQGIEKTSEALRKNKEQLKVLSDEYKKTGDSAVKSNLNAQRNDLSATIKRQKSALSNLRGELRRLESSYTTVSSELAKTRQRMTELAMAGKQNTAEYQALSIKAREYSNTLKQVGIDSQNASKGSNSLRSTLSSLTSYFGALIGIGTVVSLLRSFYDTTKQLQTLNKSMELGAKDSQAYASNMAFLKDITEQYGLELLSTSQAYNKFYIGAKEKLALEDIQLIFEKISKSASLMGLSVADQAGIFRALEQMMSKGTVQAEELRGQLGDRLPGAFEIMARSMGVTTAELGKLMQDGKVMSADVLPNFARELEKTFGADKVERIENITASENRLKNEWVDLVDNINNGNGIITKSIMAFYDLTSGIVGLINSKKTLSDELSKEQLELNLLVGRITSANVSNTERIKLLDELKSNYPAFIAMLGDEDTSNKNLLSTLESLNSNYRERIAMQIQLEEENEVMKERDKITRMSLIAENNLYNRLNELNLKYNLGLVITKDNLQETANQLQQVGKLNLSVWETVGIEYLQNTLSRLVPALEKVNKKYNDIRNNNGIIFSAGETVSESVRQNAENQRAEEYRLKKQRESDSLKLKSLSTDKKTNDLAKKRLDFIFELKKAENDLTQSTLSGLDLEKAKIEEVYQERLKKAKELKANQDALDKIESLKTKETDTATYRYGTEDLIKQLEKEKELYELYEESKSLLIDNEVTERYSKQLTQAKDFNTRLQNEIDKLNEKEDVTSVEKERLDKLLKIQKEHEDALQKIKDQSFINNYTSTLSLEEKISIIQNQFAKKRESLSSITDDNIRKEKLAILKQQEQDAINSAKNESYATEKQRQSTFDKGLNLTRREFKNRLDSLKEYLKNSEGVLEEGLQKEIEAEIERSEGLANLNDLSRDEKMLLEEKESIMQKISQLEGKSPDEAEELLKRLTDINLLLGDIKEGKLETIADTAMTTSTAFNAFSNAVGDANEELANTLSVIAEIASDIGGLVKSFQQGGLVGLIVGLVVTLAKWVGSIFSNARKNREENRKLQQEITDWQNQIYQAQLDYNASVRERWMYEAMINDLYTDRVTNLKEQLAVMQQQKNSVLDDMQSALNRLLNSETIVDQGLRNKRFLGIKRKKKEKWEASDAIWELLGYTPEDIANGIEITDELIERLRKLNAEKAFTGDAKAEYDRLMALVEQYGSIEEAIRQAEIELLNAITGTTAQALGDSIRDGIASGKRSFQDFADDIEGFLRNAILAGMSASVIEPQMQQLQDLLGTFMEDGILTEEERQAFEDKYAQIVEQAGQYLDLINQAGVNIGDDLDMQSAKDGIKRITESQADRLTGILTGMQVDVIASRQILMDSRNLLNSSLDNLIMIEVNTRRTYEGVERIETILQNNQQQSLGL